MNWLALAHHAYRIGMDLPDWFVEAHGRSLLPNEPPPASPTGSQFRGNERHWRINVPRK